MRTIATLRVVLVETGSGYRARVIRDDATLPCGYQETDEEPDRVISYAAGKVMFLLSEALKDQTGDAA